MIKQITDGMHAFRFGVSVMLVVFLTSALQSDACAQSLGATLSAGDIPCEGGSSSVTISASGGQPPYSYSVNGGSSYQNSPGFQLAAGLYTQIQVLDANGTVYVLSSIEISDGPPGPPTTYFPDADADGFGLGNSVQLCYDPGAGYSLINSDCNDSNPFVNPNEPTKDSCSRITMRMQTAMDLEPVPHCISAPIPAFSMQLTRVTATMPVPPLILLLRSPAMVSMITATA